MRSLLCPENEQLTEEELRLAGFLKFIELFHKASATNSSHDSVASSGSPIIGGVGARSNQQQPWSAATSGKKNAVTSSDIPITFTTFNVSTFVANELSQTRVNDENSVSTGTAQQPSQLNAGDAALTAGGTGSATLGRRTAGISAVGAIDQTTAIVSIPCPPLDKSAKLAVIAAEMQHPNHGAKVRDRRWHLRFYEKAFVGNEFVDWLVQRFTDIETREEAVIFGNELLRKV
jgi:hypothetical protein